MPPPLCAKCREAFANEGDSWCLGCISWEALGRELSGHWDQPGARLLANDFVVSCARQVRALRSLSAGLAREAGSVSVAGSGRASHEPRPAGEAARSRADPRAELPRARQPLPPPPPAPRQAKAEEESEGDEEEDEEEEDKEDDTPIGVAPKRKPPGPDGPSRGPGSTRTRSPRGSGERRRSHHREDRDRRSERGRDRQRSRERRGDRKKTKSGRRRGGRKHQRLGRLAGNPFLRVHRKASAAFLELGSLTQGRAALDRLC
eukprot:s2350_g4.t1